MFCKNNHIILVAIILMWVSCVKSLKTGYNIMENDIENIKLLKCSYLFNAIFNMKVHKIKLENHNKKSVLEETFTYAFLLKTQMSTLFKVESLGSLWLLNLYLLYLRNIVRKLDCTNKENYDNILNTLDYVIAKLIKDSKECPKGSQFFISDLMIKEYSNIGMPNVYSLQKQTNNELERLIAENHNELPWCRKIMKRLKKDVLFMRILLEPIKFNHMMITYNVQVKWGQAQTNIDKFYKAIRYFSWINNNFQDLKIYYNAVFGFLKIIMLRLTWKHILYLKYQDLNNIKYLVRTWIVILNSFSSTLHLEKDVMINTVIGKMIYYNEDLNVETMVSKDELEILKFHRNSMDSLIEVIIPFLRDLCVDLDCYATSEFILNGNELIPFNKHNFLSKPQHVIGNYNTIIYYSIRRRKPKKILRKSKNSRMLYSDEFAFFIRESVDKTIRMMK
ncbi:uncharacterized protein LOC126905583 isoform X2 [Daktulosphaira vitifoliae]|uniref:uncharacterized protein LOC126905583 isoform X2 n=1 Tax=Daktulosphaira vitifoliae TaxID=58002 RepID=UPI0021A9A71F|nr:uncharacterized protein LOC126905583 isoform X2 [Daktulosphaira vitifoliae]